MANEEMIKCGYYGTDPIEAAVYKFMAERVSQENDDPGEIHFPTVKIAAIESKGDETLVYGTFLIENFRIINSDTMECVSSAFAPGIIHVDKNGRVTDFEELMDCESYGKEAKEMFGRHFDAYVKIDRDEEGIPDKRLEKISEYVRRNGLKVTKVQDEGWDPEDLDV